MYKSDMAGLNEVPTDELLSFQDFPAIHSPNTNDTQYTGAEIKVDITQQGQNTFNNFDSKDDSVNANPSYEADVENTSVSKSFWTIEYYQQFFNVDTIDVLDRIVGSVFPKRDSTFKNQVKARPDLYGPFWIAVTLVFTIAISGNIANYLQHANVAYHWRYDFHLVSYAATTIFLYVTVVPLSLWGLLKWSINTTDLEGLEDCAPPKVLELICIYGYSLFIYIPVSVLWTIPVSWFQWLLVVIAALLSGSVLLFTLALPLRLSKHKLLITSGIIVCHLLLAVGFMLYFFHMPSSSPLNYSVSTHNVSSVHNASNVHSVLSPPNVSTALNASSAQNISIIKIH